MPVIIFIELSGTERQVEAQPGVPAESFAPMERDIAHHVKSMVGITVEARVVAPGTIARSQGKAMRVRDLRPKG